MELKEHRVAPTFASKLGDVPHVSGLLRRLAKTGGANERVAAWLLKVAVQRGARHYRREFDPSLPPDSPEISDEEIGIGLCLGQHPYDLDQLRAAAQLLSSRRVNATRLCRLAVEERCEPVLLHIASLAERFAPELQPWAFVRPHLPPRPVPRTDALPHWSRLVSHTGVTAHGGPARTDWLCRHEYTSWARRIEKRSSGWETMPGSPFRFDQARRQRGQVQGQEPLLAVVRKPEPDGMERDFQLKRALGIPQAVFERGATLLGLRPSGRDTAATNDRPPRSGSNENQSRL